MKLGIVGSRFCPMDVELLSKIVLHLMSKDIITEPITHIVSGGARGADKLAEKLAAKGNIPMIIHDPFKYGDYNFYKAAARDAGKSMYQQKKYASENTYFRRNKLIAEDSDLLLALMEYQKPSGTLNTIKWALSMDKPVIVYDWVQHKLFNKNFYPQGKGDKK